MAAPSVNVFQAIFSSKPRTPLVDGRQPPTLRDTRKMSQLDAMKSAFQVIFNSAILTAKEVVNTIVKGEQGSNLTV